MKKKVVFRVRRQYFDATVTGIKKVELRKYSTYWIKRLLRLDPPKIAIFICGTLVHKREILKITVGTPEHYLGRPLSAWGKRDIPTEICIGTHLGKEIVG